MRTKCIYTVVQIRLKKSGSSFVSVLFIFWIRCGRLSMVPGFSFCVALKFGTEFTHCCYLCAFSQLLKMELIIFILQVMLGKLNGAEQRPQIEMK